MRVECPKCNKALKVDDNMAGKRGRCPGCGEVFVLPTAGGIAGSPAASQVKQPPAEPASAEDGAPDDRPALPSVIEALAKEHKERMDRANTRACLGCLFTLLFFPVGIALFISSSARKRKARAEASDRLREIKLKYETNAADLFTLALESPTLAAGDSDSLLPLIDEAAFQRLQEQRAKEAQEEQRRRESEAKAKAEADAVAAPPELFRQHVPHETPDVIGVAYWTSLGSLVGTGVAKLVFGGLSGTEHRVGLVAVTGTHLYVVDLGMMVGENLTLHQLRTAVGKPSVRKATLRKLKANSRAEILDISGELSLKATFARCYHESNPGKAQQIAQAITAARR